MLSRLRSLQVGSQILAPMGGVQQAGVQQSDQVVPVVAPQVVPDPSVFSDPTDLSPDEKLNVFAQVVDEVAAERALAQLEQAPAQMEPTQLSAEPAPLEPTPVQPTPVQPTPVQPTPISATGTSKEYLAASTPDVASIDAGSHTGVEYEPVPEISPEVESFMQHVEEHEDQLPQEVVVAGDDIQLQPAHYAAQPVVVLPYDKEAEKAAVFKGPQWSVRWLLEFGHKIIKMFGGKVIYLQSESETKQ